MAAISRISAHSAQANSVSITTPQAGDVILVFAHRDGSTTSPTLATGYQDWHSGGANTNSARLAFKISDGTETTSGTWTNATSVAVGVYRGVDPNTPFGHSAVQGGTVANGANMTYPALTVNRADSTSWVVGLGAGRAVTNAGTNAPSGMGTRSSATDIAIFDTGGTVSSWSAQTATVTTTATQGYRAYTVELLARRESPGWSGDPLIQSVSALPMTEAGNAIQCLFPNATLSNNLLVMVLTWETTNSRTISSVQDDTSTNWTNGKTQTGDNTGTFRNGAIYYRAGAPSGIKKVTVTFSGNVSWFCFTLMEFTGAATSSVVDGTPTATDGVLSPILTAGSITTTQANSLVVNYGCDSYSYDPSLTFQTIGMSPASGFAFAAANMTGQYAVQYGIKAAAGAVNPEILYKKWATSEIVDLPCQSISIAFKCDGSGTTMPSGIRIKRIQAENCSPPVTYPIQFPCSGNLLVGCATSWVNVGVDWNGITDTRGNSWTESTWQNNADASQSWYVANPSTAHDLRIVNAWTGSSFRGYMTFYDVVGAATVSPLDTVTNAQGTQSGAGADVTAAPVITPTTANGLIILNGGTPMGPSSGLFNPSGAYFGNHIYTGETDSGLMNNGDYKGHYYNPDTSQLSFSWHSNSPSASGYTISAQAFKAATTFKAKTPTIVGQAVKRASFY